MRKCCDNKAVYDIVYSVGSGQTSHYLVCRNCFESKEPFTKKIIEKKTVGAVN